MLNLGTLQFALAVDTRALAAAKNRIEEFGRAVANTQAAANRGADNNISALRKQENAMLSSLERLNNARNQISKSVLEPKVRTDMIERAGRLFNDLSKAIADSGKSVDPTKLDRAVAAYRNGISQILKDTSELSKAAASSSTSVEGALLRQSNAYERAAERVRNLNAQIERSKLNTDIKTSLTSGPDNALASLKATMTSGVALNPSQYSQAFNEFNQSIGNTRRQFSGLVTQGNTLTATMEQTRATLRGLGASFLLVNGHLGGMSTRMFALSQISATAGIKVAAAAGALVSFGLTASLLSRGAVNTSIQLERASKSLETIYGNSMQAGMGMDFVRKISDQAGVSFKETASAYARYIAAGRSVNQSAEETNRQFQIVALAAGKLSLGAEDTVGVFRALEQILSKGKVQSEELRGQLGDRLPGAFAIAAKAMGVTVAQLSDMMKKGSVLSDEFVPKFVNALKEAYNIDVSKSVTTTQAALNQLSNSVTFMYDSFNKSTNVVATFRTIIGGVTAVVNYAAANMDKLIKITVGITGAVLGAITSFVAMRAALIGFAIIQAITTWMTTFIGLAASAKTITELWTLAQTALNVAMMANPVGAVASVLVRLIAVAAGAYYGYTLLTDAVQNNNKALADTSGAEAFIAMQLRMRDATDATVQAMIRRQAVQLQTAKSNLAASISAVRQTQTEIQQLEAQRKGLGGMSGEYGLAIATATAQATGRLQFQTKTLNEARVATVNQTKAVEGLVAVLHKPITDIPSILGGEGTSGGGSSGGSKAQANIDQILGLIDEYTAAQQKLSSLSTLKDSRNLELIDDVANAREQLRKLSSEELVMAAAALDRAGLSTGNLTDDITHLISATRISNEQSRAFTQVWQNIDRDLISLKGLQKVNDYLMAGGDPKGTFIVEALTQAEDALRKLDPEHVAAIKDRLQSLGYSGNTAAESLAKLFTAQDKSKQLASTLSDIDKAMHALNDRTQDAIALQEAYNKGYDVGNSADKILKNAKTLREYRDSLLLLGFSAEQTKALMEAMWTSMNKADLAEANLDKVKEAAQRWKSMWEGIRDDTVNAIIDIATSLGDFEQKITDFFLNIVKKQAQYALDNVFRGLFEGIPGLGTASPDQNQALAINTTSIDKNTQALFDLTNILRNGSTGSGTNSSGGGILGGILGGITSIFTGGTGAGISAIGSSLLRGIAAKSPGRAVGGPLIGGNSYRVSEQGVNGEVFFPGTSGNMVSLSKLASPSNFSIDARATIDARGATPDAVAALESAMIRREARLRDELAIIIDNRIFDNRMRNRDSIR